MVESLFRGLVGRYSFQFENIDLAQRKTNLLPG